MQVTYLFCCLCGHAALTARSLLGTSVGVLRELWVQGLDPDGVSSQAFPVLWQLFLTVVNPLRKLLVIVPGILCLSELGHVSSSCLGTAASFQASKQGFSPQVSPCGPVPPLTSSAPSILCLGWE